MFEIVLIVIAAIAVAIAAILVIAATTQPDTFSVQRSTRIAAAPDAIFPLINDLHAHRSWSPFDNDPGIQRSYSGAPKGPGSAMDFADRKAGTGRVEITEASPPSKVMMRLRMSKPFKCDNVIKFSLAPHGRNTDVTWAMSGPKPFMAKVMSTIMNCDKMVGRKFEQGLAELKAIAEKQGGAREVA